MVIARKLDEVEKQNSQTEFDTIRKQLAQLHSLQSEYLENEKVFLECVDKIKELLNNQNSICKEMLRWVSWIFLIFLEPSNFYSIMNLVNGFLSEMEPVNPKHMEQEVDSFGEKRMLDIWKTYLKHQMESIKATIAKNMNL